MLEKLKANRSCRSFLQEELPREDLEKIVEAISYSASARNAQNIRVLVTREEERCNKIFPYTRWVGAITWNPKEEEAPKAYILLALATETASPNDYIDMGIALQSMSLVARDLDYGTCILGAFDKKEVASIMGLGEGYFPYLLLALGKAKEEVEIVLCSQIEKPYERLSESQHRVFKLEKSAYVLTSKHGNK